MKYKDYDQLQIELYPKLMELAEHREYNSLRLYLAEKAYLRKDGKYHLKLFNKQNKLDYKLAKREFRREKRARIKVFHKARPRPFRDKLKRIFERVFSKKHKQTE